MLLPINLKNSKSVALSIIKTDQGYSIKPCIIVNGFGMDEIDSSFILTKDKNDDSFSPIALYEFDNKFDTKGEDLMSCLEEAMIKLTKEFN